MKISMGQIPRKIRFLVSKCKRAITASLLKKEGKYLAIKLLRHRKVARLGYEKIGKMNMI